MEASPPRSPHGPSRRQPVWGPPQDPLISTEPIPGRGLRQTPARRRHPAARARQIAGWAAVSTSAAIVGYMVTANAASNSSQSATQQPVVVTPTTQASTAAQSEADNDDATATTTPATTPMTAPAVTTPATVPATVPSVAVPATTRTQPAQQRSQPPQGGPNSSSHGS